MKILAVTGTRADWGLLVPVLDLLRDDLRFDLEIVATGQHTVGDSDSINAISTDGHKLNYVVNMDLSADDPATIARGMGAATAGIGKVIEVAKPNLLLVLGDRYEILAAVLAAVVAKVPIAHLCGGDITEGAIDDSIRHALTKLSALHFVTNTDSAARVVQMGENPAHVYNVGSTGIDRIKQVQTMGRAEFFESVRLAPKERNFIITFHPATLSSDSLKHAEAMLEALTEFSDCGLIFTGSNADPGAREIDNLIKDYVRKRENAVFIASLGSRRYFSALRHCNLVIGNSSSGLMEAPSFQIPTINIGDRQARRPRAESVVDCAPKSDAIAAAIQAGLGMNCQFVQSPYGDGAAAPRIVSVLGALGSPVGLVRKSFKDRFYE